MIRKTVAIAAAALLLAACGGQPHGELSSPGTSQRYDGGARGFTIDLAPGWKRAGEDVGTVTFISSTRQATMEVHFELARNTNLATAADQTMQRLTGDAAPPRNLGSATLSGLPAMKVQADATGKGGSERVQAVVAQQGDLVWALALAGLRAAFGQARQDFAQMAQSFHIGSSQPSPLAQAAVGMPAPDAPALELGHLSGPIVVTFFATGCSSCRDALSLLQQHASRDHGRYLILVVDTHDDPRKVPAALKKLGVSFPERYDRDGKLYQSYGLRGLPSTFFLDAGHVVRKIWFGPLDDDSLTQGLHAINGE